MRKQRAAPVTKRVAAAVGAINRELCQHFRMRIIGRGVAVCQGCGMKMKKRKDTNWEVVQ